jgi:hypothetical protein
VKNEPHWELLPYNFELSPECIAWLNNQFCFLDEDPRISGPPLNPKEKLLALVLRVENLLKLSVSDGAAGITNTGTM